MTKKITIAIDAMGGENAPKKNIEGLNIFLSKILPKFNFTGIIFYHFFLVFHGLL